MTGRRPFLHRLQLAACGAWLTCAAWASAQEGAAPPQAPPSAPEGGGAIIQDDTSGLYFQWGLTALGAGLVLYAVCRSSRRN